MERYWRHRFAWLFFSLLVTLVAQPVIETMASSHHPLEVLLAVNLVAAIASVASDRRIQVLLVLAGGFVAVRGLQAALNFRALLPWSEALWMATCLLAAAATVRHALRAGPVDAERIFAALDAYLLAGMVFAVCYWVLESTWPGSLGGSSAQTSDLASAIYFSFVTIATLGYGDIVPASKAARGLAIVEAVGGQMYLAVLVARLVSLYAKQADEREETIGRKEGQR